MEREKFFEQRQHYCFDEKKPEKTVERKDSVEADGRHKIELSFAFDNEEAQKAVLRFIAEVNELHEIKSLGDIAAATTWLNGYITALKEAKVIDEEQATQLLNILDIASRQQYKLITARQKRGER